MGECSAAVGWACPFALLQRIADTVATPVPAWWRLGTIPRADIGVIHLEVVADAIPAWGAVISAVAPLWATTHAHPAITSTTATVSAVGTWVITHQLADG